MRRRDQEFPAAVATLRHERVPFVSYPYEWTFSMLRDAALLQLDLLRAALAEDMIPKDASPYNVQWRGTSPVFIDVGSFERLPDGEPWAGYRQFCCLFLYPLMVQAYAGLPFQPWLRGSLEGIEPAQARAILRGRRTFRRGVMTHVALHARLEKRESDRDTRSEVKRAGFRKELIDANAARLEKLVAAARLGHARYRLVRLRRAVPLRARGARAEGRFRPRRVRRAGVGACVGSRLQRRPLLTDRCRARSLRRRRRRRSRHRRGSVQRPSRRGRRARSCRSSWTSPTRRRPAAGAGSSALGSRIVASRTSCSAWRSSTTSRSRRTFRWPRWSRGWRASGRSSWSSSRTATIRWSAPSRAQARRRAPRLHG